MGKRLPFLKSMISADHIEVFLMQKEPFEPSLIAEGVTTQIMFL